MFGERGRSPALHAKFVTESAGLPPAKQKTDGLIHQYLEKEELLQAEQSSLAYNNTCKYFSQTNFSDL